MSFYSFPQITERDSSLATWGMRTSFMEKMFDTFYIFSGSSVFFSPNYGFGYFSPGSRTLQFGLLDWPLFF